MFETFIVQPVFNLLVLIYTVLPGHNFGLAIILFTIIVRIFIHPLVKKQLHHSKALRELKPELEAIKKASKGDRQEEARLTMELYKEREIKPWSSMGPVLIQVLILIGLFASLRQVTNDHKAIVDNAYGWLKDVGILKDLAVDISKFDFTLFGLVDLSRAVNGPAGFYFPALLLVMGSAVAQYYMGKQTLSEEKQASSLRKVLRRYGLKDKSDKSFSRSLWDASVKFIIPLVIFLFTYGLASALALYWMVSGIAGYIQQKNILKQDETELLQVKKDQRSKKAKA